MMPQHSISLASFSPPLFVTYFTPEGVEYKTIAVAIRYRICEHDEGRDVATEFLIVVGDGSMDWISFEKLKVTK